VLEGGGAGAIETCRACRGYLKSVPTLRAWTGDEVCLADLATIDLDLAALQRGFDRPDPKPLDPLATVVVL
jgi:FdhE protein